MVFKLPLVAFEKYMLAENTRSYPRSFVVQLQLAGDMRREALEAAWQATLERHPMLRATLEKSRREWQWTFSDRPLKAIDWGGADDPLGFTQHEMIDLTHEPGVRLWARASQDSARLVLQFHHAACDGIGGLGAVRDLLTEYALRTGAVLPALPPLDADLLKTRDSFHIGKLGFGEWFGHVGATIYESLRLVGRRPLPLAAPSNRNTEDGLCAPFPGLLTHPLTSTELGALQITSKALGVTINDLMVAFSLRAIAEWNDTHGVGKAQDWLRINMPTNLRMPGDERMPAANVMSFTFVDRRISDTRELQALVKSIHAETEAIKVGRRGLYFIAQLGILSAIPGAMGLAVSPKKCFATAVVSNVGDLGRMFSEAFPRREGKVVLGNLLLESITGTPPLRPLTRVGVGLMTYAGQMSICLLCDRHLFTPTESRQFLEMLLRHIAAGNPQIAPSALQT